MEKQRSDTLLKAKKLSLIVDLDKTILHATSVCDIVEWIKKQKLLHKNNAITKDMITILNDQYTVKFRYVFFSDYLIIMTFIVVNRPGLQRFLKHMSRLYELHVYTMGRKPYAEAILDQIDPYRTLFQGQILTRDSNGSIMKKRLDRIFPTDTSTVLVLDDCAEIWNDCPNLIHIKPYEYFIGVYDVNAVPSINPRQFSSVNKSFLRLSNCALSQSFMKENEEDEDLYQDEKESDESCIIGSDSDTVINSSDNEQELFSLDPSFDNASSTVCKDDPFSAPFSVPSGLGISDQERGDSFENYFDQCIADIIPSQPEQDDILDNTRKVR